MNNIIKKLCSIILLVSFCLITSHSTVYAANYGGDSFGGGNFGVGLTQSSNNSTQPSQANNQSTPSRPECKDTAPGIKAPWVYGASSQNGTSILIYFAAGADPINHYALEFGEKSGEYSSGSTDIGNQATRTYLVQFLKPNTTYYFRVRGGNGCATGEWSNEISAKTKGILAFQQLQTELLQSGPDTKNVNPSLISNEATQDLSVIKSADEATKNTGYKVQVLVLDKNKKPVKDAQVTIHSKVQKGTTNEKGTVLFSEVEAGQHQILLEYQGYTGEQNIDVSGDVKEYKVTISIEQKNVMTSPTVLAAGGVLLVIILILLGLLTRARRSSKQ